MLSELKTKLDDFTHRTEMDEDVDDDNDDDDDEDDLYGKFQITNSNKSNGRRFTKKVSLEKISEIDETEVMSRAGSAGVSRPLTTNRLPAQRSQATFRSSSQRKDNDDYYERLSDTNDYETLRLGKNVLLTELGENIYEDQLEEDSLDEDFDLDERLDDDDYVEFKKKKKKPAQAIIYPNDIDNEKDFDTDLEEEEEVVKPANEEENSPKTVYRKMCKNLNVIPCRYFMAHIDKQKLVLKYHQFSDDEIRAIAKPLWNNFNVEKLHLDGNWIECAGAKYISRMIRQNDFITELSLADNRLGERVEGTLEVARMLTENCILKKLNLSGNCFSDKDIEMITVALEKNRLLKELDLSHNQFGDEGGKLLGQYISSNDTLEILNISWNNFRKSCKEIGNGLKENVRLKKFNVSFNGFDMGGGRILAEVIKHNNTIEHLNISKTRLNVECAAAIANALEQNDSLKTLNISNNPLTTSGALAIIYAIKLNNSSILEKLDLSEIPVTKDFDQVLKEIHEVKPNFKCLKGPTISTSNTKSVLYDGAGKVDFEKILNALKNK